MKMGKLFVTAKNKIFEQIKEFKMLDEYGTTEILIIAIYFIILMIFNGRLLISASIRMNTRPNYLLMIIIYLGFAFFYINKSLSDNRDRRKNKDEYQYIVSSKRNEIDIIKDIEENGCDSVELAVKKANLENALQKNNVNEETKKDNKQLLIKVITILSPIVSSIISLFDIERIKNIMISVYENWNGFVMLFIVFAEMTLFFVPFILPFFLRVVNHEKKLDDETIAHIELKIKCIDMYLEKMKERAMNM